MDVNRHGFGDDSDLSPHGWERTDNSMKAIGT
jgi:hypothetical protein